MQHIITAAELAAVAAIVTALVALLTFGIAAALALIIFLVSGDPKSIDHVTRLYEASRPRVLGSWTKPKKPPAPPTALADGQDPTANLPTAA